MKNKTDIRPESEIRQKKLLGLVILFFLAMLFTNCMSLGESVDRAENRFDAIEDLGDLSEDIADEYENIHELRRRFSYISYRISFTNSTCSEYYGHDESGNEFILRPLGITNVRVFSANRGDEDISVFLRRTWSESGDCAGDGVYSGEVDRSEEVELD